MNHFIELDYEDSSKTYWLVIHTGSRNLGVQVCKYYQDLAFKKLNEIGEIKKKITEEIKARCLKEKRRQDIGKELEEAFRNIQKPSASKELAHLEGQDFNDYIHDMKVLQTYAHLNRGTIAKIIMKEMGWKELDRFETLHNYIDTDAMILRKGAISAKKGERILIPMNMRDGSLICIGKGNEDWNFSAPHGAGRLMSRSKARETVPMKEYRESMKGIYTSCISTATVDESPMVYKPMEEIIRCIEPAAEIISIIKPVYNFKAGEE